MIDESINNLYSTLSCQLTKKINKEEKKQYGIYFTPPFTINRNLKYLKPFLNNVKTILEPSCGSCEYILTINKLLENKDIHITGIEYNKTIYESISHLSNDKINIIHHNYLEYQPNIKYDLIIGNPPFFVISKDKVNEEYYQYFDGRPNIFILFIIKSLSMLEDNGILSFVLPKNFLNCLYYNKTRQYIYQHYNIIKIIECKYDNTRNRYLDTKQETIILILQNNKSNRKINTKHNKESIDNSIDECIYDSNKFVLVNGDYLIFGEENNIKELRHLYENSTTLSNLNFKVKVGNIIWNKSKSLLTNDNTKTRLIYSTDILNNKLSMKENNKDKKNFIDKKGFTHPTLLVNRGYGVGNYNFQYCLIPGNFQYLIENHLMYIQYNNDIENEKLILLYEKVIESLNDERTKRFIKLYFSNNAINCKELNHILPIYITS